MKAIVFLAAMSLIIACDRTGHSSAKAVPDEPLHGHAAVRPAVRTSIGEVRGVDQSLGTITIAVAQGPRRERASKGPLQTLFASPAQMAGVRVGDVVEFRMETAQPGSRLLSIDAHAHRGQASPRTAPQQPQ